MHPLESIDAFDASLLIGYSIMVLVGWLIKRGSNTASLSFSLLVILGIQSYFSTYSVHYEGLTDMWKFYGVMFLLDTLLFLWISSKPSKEVLPYLVAICIMCFLTFISMFEAYFTIETTFVYYLYEIAMPTIHTYLLALLVLGVGGVKGVYNNNDTGGTSNSKTSENSFGGIP